VHTVQYGSSGTSNYKVAQYNVATDGEHFKAWRWNVTSNSEHL
jgi:hypothetical protein